MPSVTGRPSAKGSGNHLNIACRPPSGDGPHAAAGQQGGQAVIKSVGNGDGSNSLPSGQCWAEPAKVIAPGPSRRTARRRPLPGKRRRGAGARRLRLAVVGRLNPGRDRGSSRGQVGKDSAGQFPVGPTIAPDHGVGAHAAFGDPAAHGLARRGAILTARRRPHIPHGVGRFGNRVGRRRCCWLGATGPVIHWQRAGSGLGTAAGGLRFAQLFARWPGRLPRDQDLGAAVGTNSPLARQEALYVELVPVGAIETNTHDGPIRCRGGRTAQSNAKQRVWGDRRDSSDITPTIDIIREKGHQGNSLPACPPLARRLPAACPPGRGAKECSCRPPVIGLPPDVLLERSNSCNTAR